MMGLLFSAGFWTVIYTSRLYGLILFMLTNHNNRLNFGFPTYAGVGCGFRHFLDSNRLLFLSGLSYVNRCISWLMLADI